MKCKQGDLAYIRKALRPENVGKIVTCKQMLGYYIMGETVTWNGENFLAPETDYMWVVYAKYGVETMYGSSKEGMIADSWLQPIVPPDPPKEELTRELELVTVR